MPGKREKARGRDTDAAKTGRPPFQRSLGAKLFGANALILLIAVVAVGGLAYRNARKAIMFQAEQRVLGIAMERRARVEAWLEEQTRRMLLFAGDIDVRSVFSAVDGAAGEKRLRVQHDLQNWRQRQRALVFIGLYDSLGRLLVSDGSLEESRPADRLEVFRKARQGVRELGNVHLNTNETAVMNLAVPVYDKDGKIEGVLFAQTETRPNLDPILMDVRDLGTSGEAYLVGPNAVMLTPSRFHQHPQPLKHTMPMPTVLEALNGKTGVRVYKGFLGSRVVGAYAWIPNPGWALIVEIGTKEAFAALRTIALQTGIAAFLALVILLAVSGTLTRRWTHALERLADASLRVSHGDLGVQVEEGSRRDEIGTVIHQFNRMTRSLKRSREELDRSQARLVQAETLAGIGQLVAGVVHEMRNPLSSIKINLHLLQRKFDETSLEGEHLALASEEVARLERMLTDLLDYSKPISLNLAQVSLPSVMERSANAVREEAARAGVEVVVQTEPAGTVRLVRADDDILERVLVNLLSNAVQASPEGAAVLLSCERISESSVRIEIVDHGHGMNATTRERMFEPFFTTRDDGTGLGMSNVKKFVEALDGRIEVESEEGRGTTVRLHLLIGGSDGDVTGRG